MKKHILKAFLLCALTLAFAKANAQELQFTYDGAGNQTERKWVCVNCTVIYPPSLASAPTADEATQTNKTANADNLKSAENRPITAYPNPVAQILNVKWENDKNYYLNRIEAYSSQGITIYQKDIKNREPLSQQAAIGFDKQMPGFYYVRAIYSDGQQKIIKVIKIDK